MGTKGLKDIGVTTPHKTERDVLFVKERNPQLLKQFQVENFVAA